MAARAAKMKHDIDKLKHPGNNSVVPKEPKAVLEKFMNDAILAQRKRPYSMCKVLTFMRSERSHDKQSYSQNSNPRLLTTFEEKHLQLHQVLTSIQAQRKNEQKVRSCEEEENKDWGSNAKIKSSSCRGNLMNQSPTPKLPKEFIDKIEAMGGTDIMLVIQKKLFPSDLDKGLAQLSMPLKQLRSDFLTEEEKSMLNAQEEIPTMLIDPRHEEFKIVLRQWDMPKNTGKVSSMYTVRTDWNEVQLSNELKEHNVVQVWSFRLGQ